MKDEEKWGDARYSFLDSGYSIFEKEGGWAEIGAKCS